MDILWYFFVVNYPLQKRKKASRETLKQKSFIYFFFGLNPLTVTLNNVCCNNTHYRINDIATNMRLYEVLLLHVLLILLLRLGVLVATSKF